ncbi:MAG TPA: phenylalanine--tRNA ligase subunit beta [Candidatus Paceibacterota bacterium]|nr:phenylalanine--tRNA ligase subunit beta [Candidatus Paceibacterota bacterium]
MKVSRAWLNKFFATELPDTEALADALTFHAAEIEESDADMLDVKVLPDRAAYLMSHRGVAKEVATALGLQLAKDPLSEALPEFPKTDRLAVSLDREGTCARYMGALVEGVSVGPSPAWLKDALESVGQRSINNVVDATNYVMLNIGQPLHAFDAAKLAEKDGSYAIQVRASQERERFTSLTGEEYELPEGVLLIADGHADGAVLGVAGVKGGARAAVTEGTTALVVETANFDATSVRRSAQRLKLFTDASSRFQNRPSPELVAYGMRDVLALITDIAGGTVIGVTDRYPSPEERSAVSVSLEEIAGTLGIALSVEEVGAALTALGFSFEEEKGRFTVLVPFERRDLSIPADLVEEVGRTIGYDRVVPVQLPVPATAPEQARFRGIERIRDFLVAQGYAEVSTPSFDTAGDIELHNPLQEERPYLRASLVGHMEEALARAVPVAPRVLGPDPYVRIFEIGTVFRKTGEELMLAMGVALVQGKQAKAADALRQDVMALEHDVLSVPSRAQYAASGQVMELAIGKLNLEKLGEDYAPEPYALGSYHPYAAYPFALRDIAVWTPEGTEESEAVNAIVKEAGDLLVRIDQFDRFEKDGRVSYAFRLVFESMERTLSDADLDPAMARITEALNRKEGWEVR